ncbi:hypothetical protein [Brevibacillus sp. MER 51]|uniref:hypothetical protein n=1 Tax=Brevibacillus sp. MER 51 TaxID=2939560 RepID=UPI00203B9B51|nr:hypothetical protein [Brevibacillus sp. MER 51]MCM3144399.1 hypothetical protein [Brevibacillus sp. MER 51]
MIKSVILCESTATYLEPIKSTNIFFPEIHSSVEVLVKLSNVSAGSKVRFYWYLSSEPNEPLGIYEIPLMSNHFEKRVVGALDLRALVNIQDLNIYQEWFVVIEYEGYIKKETFKLRKLSYTLKRSQLLSESSRFEWRV